jgi:hypothetical protein
MRKLWDDTVAFLKAPFVGQLDLVHLFLLVGIVLVFAAAWALILNHIKIAGTQL